MISNKSQVLGYDATAMQREAVLLVKWIAAFHQVVYTILLDFMSFRMINWLIIHMNN